MNNFCDSVVATAAKYRRRLNLQLDILPSQILLGINRY